MMDITQLAYVPIIVANHGRMMVDNHSPTSFWPMFIILFADIEPLSQLIVGPY